MADCLQLSNGDFTLQNWSTAASFNAGAVTITRTAPALGSPGSILIQRAGQTGSISLNGEFSYAVFGDEDCVAFMRVQEGAPGNFSYTVSLVDITTPNIQSAVLLTTASLPGSVQPPLIAISPGNGRLLFTRSATGTQNEVRDLVVWRSDDGTLVLAVPGVVSNLNGTVQATITATELVIAHPRDFGQDQTAAPRPAGSLLVVEGAIDFGEAVLNADDPGLAQVTRTFTLRNDGNDCLTITAIADSAPFSVAPGLALPVTLRPGADLMVPVVFAPVSTGNNIVRSLPVTRQPSLGMGTLECRGDAREAEARISVSPAALPFGVVAAPAVPTRTYAIANTGERTVTIAIPAPPAGSAFNWAAVAGAPALAPGASRMETVSYTVTGATAVQTGTITVTPTPGAPRTVGLSGQGCLAAGVLDVPPAAPIGFGEVQQGFRMVRTLRLRNTGNGDVSYDLRVAAGPNAALFGIQRIGDDITQAQASIGGSLAPVTRCGSGAAGTGEETLGIVFHANAAPSAVPLTAALRVEDVTNGVVTTYALSAVVTPATPVDAVLVYDVSGSMADAIGARDKLEAARAAAQLFVQLLRPSIDDRMALVTYETTPADPFPIALAAGNRPAFEAALAALAPSGATNIAGGLIVAEDEYTDPVHPSGPPALEKVMIVLTDGMENRCFQRGGAGPWYSITGRSAASGMRRPDGTPQDTQVYTPPADVRVYAIGLGQPADIDEPALNAIAAATGGYFSNIAELVASDYFTIEKYFTQIFMDAVNLAIVSDPFYTVTPGDRHVHEFDILPGDVNAMIVLYDEPGKRLPFRIETPRGEYIDGLVLPAGFGLRFHSSETARFAEIAFPVGDPHRTIGRWRVVVAHEGHACSGGIGADREKDHRKDPDRRKAFLETARPGFLPPKCSGSKEPIDYGIAIGAGSNLRMQPYVDPGPKRIGDPIRLDAAIAEAGLPVTGAHVDVECVTPSGAVHALALHESSNASAGEYTGTFMHTAVAGNYRFNFRAEGMRAGKPWRREASRTKAVMDPRIADAGIHGDPCCERLVKLLAKALAVQSPEPGRDLDAADRMTGTDEPA